MSEVSRLIWSHIMRVRELIHVFTEAIIQRGMHHDKSKMESPEIEVFEEYVPKLKNSTYGSDEYQRHLDMMKPTLAHHYANNPHHPEYYLNGVNGMTLIDLVEMFIDWKAASEQHDDGDLIKSIEYNAKRFDISPQLCRILENTARWYDEREK